MYKFAFLRSSYNVKKKTAILGMYISLGTMLPFPIQYRFKTIFAPEIA